MKSADGTTGGQVRLPGLAIFPFSGLLRHSVAPALVLTMVGDACVAVTARDFALAEELTISLSVWRFDEQAHLEELERANVPEKVRTDCWPPGLPPKENVQFVMMRHFLGRVEAAVWQEEENVQSQVEAAEKLRCWLGEFGGVRLMRSFPYLRMRAQALALHVYTGTQLLDQAWDASVAVMDVLAHVPASEASNLCVVFAVLGSALAYKQGQLKRAQQLFSAGNSLLTELLGGDDCGWESWLRTFVPPPLQQAALVAWNGQEEAESDTVPGIGSLEDDTSSPAPGNNIECWEAGATWL